MPFGNLKFIALAAAVLVAVGLTPIPAKCNCAMPPTAPGCCGDAPAKSCASSDLFADNCDAVVHDETLPAIQVTASGGLDHEFARLAAERPAGNRAALARAGGSDPPNKSPQLSDIPIFELDCSYLI